MYSVAYVDTTVAYKYWKIDMCKFESSQKDESGAKQADSSQAGHEATACFIIVFVIIAFFTSFQI